MDTVNIIDPTTVLGRVAYVMGHQPVQWLPVGYDLTSLGKYINTLAVSVGGKDALNLKLSDNAYLGAVAFIIAMSGVNDSRVIDNLRLALKPNTSEKVFV